MKQSVADDRYILCLPGKQADQMVIQMGLHSGVNSPHKHPVVQVPVVVDIAAKTNTDTCICRFLINVRK